MAQVPSGSGRGGSVGAFGRVGYSTSEVTLRVGTASGSRTLIGPAPSRHGQLVFTPDGRFERSLVLGVVPAGTELHPSFTAVLTDLTPATGGTAPQGEVGVAGIWGHRIEKTIQLHLEMKDSTGATPDSPVLVQLNLSGCTRRSEIDPSNV